MTSGTSERFDISVVIPTFNRQASLERVLRCIEQQQAPVLEVVIVDASDQPVSRDTLEQRYPSLSIRVIPTEPHVCRQRNIGIQQAQGNYIFLCDDDIEVPPQYTREIKAFLAQLPAGQAVSGLLVEPLESGGFDGGSRSLSITSVLSAFLLQHGLWGDVNSLSARFPASLLLSPMKLYFRCRGNRFSLGGWPLFTQITAPSCSTAVYGLGAAVVRREWLLHSPFDEDLDPHGIGDNYGVCLGFPGETPVAVLPGLIAKHYKITANRLPADEAYQRRVLALSKFIRSDSRFGLVTRGFLLWSLCGRFVLMALKGDASMRRSAGLAIRQVLY